MAPRAMRLLLAALATATAWSASVRGGGESNGSRLSPQPDAQRASRTEIQLMAQEAPAAIVAGGPTVEAWSVDRLPVMHASEFESESGGGGHISQFISLIAATSAKVRSAEQLITHSANVLAPDIPCPP